MTERQRCTRLIWRRTRYAHCNGTATVEVDGRPFCRHHDPAEVRARRARDQAAYAEAVRRAAERESEAA